MMVPDFVQKFYRTPTALDLMYFAPCQKDMYKAFHIHGYKPGITHVYSNFTNRSGRLHSVPNSTHVIHAGLQYFILKHLIQEWNETFFKRPKKEAVDEYLRIIQGALGKKIKIKHLEQLHDLGYLPIRIKSLPEGSRVPYGVPTFVVSNTIAGFHWLTNLIETVESSETWQISTSATIAYEFRKRFEMSPLMKDIIKFMGHDFSYRGMGGGTQHAAMSGFGHLCSFVGSDTIPAGIFAERYYGAQIDKELVFASVDATEHSVMCSWGPNEEIDCLLYLITNSTPSGIISIVSDTFDFWQLITKYTLELKDVIMSREGQVVFRPDSGDPVEIICGTTEYLFETEQDAIQFFTDYHMNQASEDCEGSYNCGNPEYQDECKIGDKYFIAKTKFEYNRHDKTYYYVEEQSDVVFEEIQPTPEMKGMIECLWDIFGGTVREDGLKQLDSHVGAIYGDSINLDRQDRIINGLVRKGFVPSVVLGIGSYSYNYVTRDSQGSAVKATDVQFGEGNHVAIFKDPKTDQKKKSAKGLLRVDLVNGEYVLRDNVTPEQEAGGCLETIFEDGKLIKFTTLNEIRERINATFK